MADRAFVLRNDVERERLYVVCARLSEDDLTRELGDGWTIAAVLAHLTFWDRRALVLLDRWQREGVQSVEDDTAAINDAALPQWRAIPPKEAVAQVLAAAEAIDLGLASASDELIEAIRTTRNTINLNRGDAHRSEHLDAIEQALHSG